MSDGGVERRTKAAVASCFMMVMTAPAWPIGARVGQRGGEVGFKKRGWHPLDGRGVMRLNLWTAVTMALALATGPAGAMGLYECRAKDAVELGDDGTAVRNERTEVMMSLYAPAIIDTFSAVVRNTVSTQQWQIVRGSANLDLILVPLLADTAAATNDFIRLRLSNDPVLFLAFWVDMLVTGTCEEIG